jgi:hypothetical protein
VNPSTTGTTFELDHIIPGDFAALQKGPLGRSGIGHRRNAEETDRQQASHQDGCE